MRFFIYGNAGGIDEVKKELNKPKKTFKTLTDVFDHLVKNHNNAFTKEDLVLRLHAYDDRIDKNVYMISTVKYKGMKRIVRMFISYLVEV